MSDIKSELEILLQSGTQKQYLSFLKNYHDADIADAIEELTKDQQKHFFNQLAPELTVDVIEEMELPQQRDLISELRTELAARFIEEMEPDDRADLIEELQETNEEKVEEIIDALPQEDVSDIQELLAYEEDSAGAIMTTEFVAIPENLTVAEAIKNIKKQDPPDSEASFYIFIVDDQNKLKGVTTLRNLIISRSSTKVKTIRSDYTIKTHVSTDQEEVARLFQKYDVVSMPVVDDNNHLIGLITIDDIVDVVVEEATEDFYKLSGTSDLDEEHLLTSSILKATVSRSPWLLLTIGGGIIASYLITKFSSAFSPDLFPLALSLSFIPMLMGLGGNVGNQSATIMVRGIATGHIKTEAPLKYILKEISVGFIIGLVMGICVYIFNLYIGNQTWLFSSIVSLALMCNIFVATLIGSALPLLFNKLNIDPAVASAPFISTALDIIGQIIYFSLTLKILTFF